MAIFETALCLGQSSLAGPFCEGLTCAVAHRAIVRQQQLGEVRVRAATHHAPLMVGQARLATLEHGVVGLLPILQTGMLWALC